MIGHTLLPQQKPPTPHELTPRDDAKKIVSEVLKRVDQLIRKGELDHAQLEIGKAKEVDPRNVYAFALEERILMLKTEIKRTEEEQLPTVSLKPLLKEKNARGETTTSPLPSTQKPSMTPTVTISTSQKQTTITLASVPLSVLTPATSNPPESKQGQTHDRTNERNSYRKALVEAWHNGILSSKEKRQLNEMRATLEISDEEHEQIIQEVKYGCYRNALKRYLMNKNITPSNIKALKDIRSILKISEDEHIQIESELINAGHYPYREKILVIDDDVRLLEMLSATLEDSGFDVITLSTSDEAYALLRKLIPDLILCDINLETSTMGGFTFYEKVQESKNLQYIPFVFLTGLTDDVLVRTGKELGVDDYLMKPISEKSLLSAIRGKLKRFKQLQKISEFQAPVLVTA